MSLKDIIGDTVSQWMKGTGPERDIVLGSRVRLARNLAGVPFPSIANAEQRRFVLDQAQSAIEEARVLADVDFIRIEELSPLERRLLVERHLISPAHAEQPQERAVALRKDEAVSIMVNEEDHFRIQALFPGLQPAVAWTLCSQVDDALDRVMDFAFGEQYGYLTACPTNVGTGMRASIMMHLPALTMTDQVKRVIGAVTRFGLAVRGIYGEGTEVLGNIYQLSNQVTLGHAEEEIIEHLQSVAMQVLEQERSARETILAKGKLQLEDRIYRSYGILANARMITSHEAMQRLSDVRLGIDLGVVTGIEPRILQELMVMIRPAHLQKLMGQELDAPARDEKRAALIRERLRLAGTEGS